VPPLRRVFAPAASTALAVLGLVLLLWIAGWSLRPDTGLPVPTYDPEELAAIRADRDVSFDPENAPTIQRDVDYAEGEGAAWWPKGESPIFDLVEDGDLPPVAERVGSEPLVLEPIDGVHRHGGTWHRVANSDGDVGVITWRMSGATLVRWSPLGYPIRPHVAKGWEVSDDGRVYTFHLRKGMRWSDGHPFTARDIGFWLESDFLSQEGDAWPDFLRTGIERANGSVEVVDDHTVRFEFAHPHGIFLEQLCTNPGIYLPEHYLRRFHPELGDREAIAAELRRRDMQVPEDADGFEGQARKLYNQLRRYDNPECPQIYPWILRTHRTDAPFVYVRNPYFWAVDPEGNQLPYIDRVVFQVKRNDMIPVAAANGEISFQRRHIQPKDYTLLMASRASGGYEVYHWYPGTRSTYTVFPNLNRKVDPERPATAKKHELLNDERFRQALSLAIDRETIIDAENAGDLEPAQIDPGPESPFHHPRLFKSFVEHDPARANELLDEIGLTERDSEGHRTFRDGSRMQFYLNTAIEWTGPGPAQLLIDDWAEIGVRVILRNRARALFSSEKRALEHDFTVWTGESEIFPLIGPRNFVPTYIESFFAPGFGEWFRRGGPAGSEDAAESPLAIEPPEDHPLRRAQDLYLRALSTADREEQRRLMAEVMDIAAEQVWTISISTPPPQPVVVSERLANVPENALDGAGFFTPANAGIETFAFTGPQPNLDADERAAIDQRIAAQMTTITTRFDRTDVAAGEDGERRSLGGSVLATVVVWTFWSIVALLIVLAAVRHPFVARRLLIMVPTLLVISIVTWVIIQLPPGNFLETRIDELRMEGDEAAVQRLEKIREDFDLDESQLTRYLRWVGASWFLSFQDEDRGLLQGHLGLSMQDSQPVNDKVGDRLLLTVVVSLLSICFIWAVALPIGIYSAVRQYSPGDYLFTFVGFVGMSIPNFLLALVLMFLAKEWFGISVSGLFSPEYAAMPGWTWGKVVDLLQHVWLPVLVIGTAGTAGLIRVMRGNLLDELGKPYVTTARAKGVRPIRLLVKYPVRLALNPFISTIGHIFPQLVSGAAIVAMVLSLPMVGPLMLSGLMMEDMYLAGSMLMVLSLLGVFGTLVSDLLLLWLDPRIRMEGKAVK